MSPRIDPHALIRRRVEERLTRHVGRTVRVGGEADRLILAIRDEMLARRQSATAVAELQFVLEESRTELDEFRRVNS